MKDFSVFTVCNVKYLDKVMVLAESLYKSNGIKLDVFIFDKQRTLNLDEKVCDIHWIEDLNIPNFHILSFKYSVIELTTALKPYLALYILNSKKKVIFLDPDTKIFNDLSSISSTLESKNIMLTPHYFSPKINGLIDDEQLMRFGTFNLGFFGVNDSAESKRFLNWWSERCISNAFDDPQYGIFTDQKWVSIAPAFFNLHISYDPGLNLSYWNLDEREITKNSNGDYVVNDEYPLLFFHFSFLIIVLQKL